MRESTKSGRERENDRSGERGRPGDSRSSDRPSFRRRWHRAVRRRRLARADRLGSSSRVVSRLRRLRRRKSKESAGGVWEPFRLIVASWSKSWRRRRARRRARAGSKVAFTLVPAVWSKRWRRWRSHRRARAGSKVAFTRVPAVWSKRWRRWRSHRRVIRSARSARRLVPASWLRWWRRWRGGATKRTQRRRDQIRALIPPKYLSWWKKQNSAQRAKVRSRVVLGVSAVAGLVFALVIFQGQDRGPAELTVGFQGPTPGPAELAVGRRYLREQTAPITVLDPVPLITAPDVGYNCGSAAFKSALPSAYGPDPIRGVACIGSFGIGNVRSSGPEAPGGIGFFGVDTSGFWRLVSMVQSDGDVAASLPKDFPPELIRIWSTL